MKPEPPQRSRSDCCCFSVLSKDVYRTIFNNCCSALVPYMANVTELNCPAGGDSTG